MTEIHRVIEAVLFLADEPTSTNDLAQLLEVPAAEIEAAARSLAQTYEARGAGLVIREVAGGWRITTHPEAAPYLERFVADVRGVKLTQAALETLAIIAYRQPVTRAQVAEIRGVASDGVIKTLIARGLVQEVGNDPGPGLAILYATTVEFLEKMGLKSLQDLPSLPEFMPDSIAVERMESGLGPGV